MNNIGSDFRYPIDLSSIPKSWEAVCVGDAAIGVRPGFASGKHNRDSDGIPHLRPMNIDRRGGIDLSDVKYVIPNNPLRLQSGDVLFNNTNSPDLVGKTAPIVDDAEVAYSNHMTRIRPAEGISYRFMAHQLHYLWMTGYFKYRCVKHVNQASISSSALSDTVPFLVAPGPEQERIVAEIEKQFSRLDAGVAALRRVEANLKRYKAALLKAACTGQLTADWRAANPDVEPASKLLDRILRERRRRWEEAELAKMIAKGRTPKDDRWKARYRLPVHDEAMRPDGLPTSWAWIGLEPLLSVLRTGIATGPFGSLLKKHEHREAGVPVVGINNIRDMEFEPGGWFCVTETKASELSSFDLLPSDVVISRSGTVGKPCVIPAGLGPARMSTNLMRVSLFPKGMNPHFFCITLLGDPRVQSQIRELCKGSTRNFLNKTILMSLRFPLPPSHEQSVIVDEAQRLLSLATNAVDEVRRNRQRADRLRQSTLKAAFEGKLVEQDPTDEPATAVLKRIRAEREKQATKSRPRQVPKKRRKTKGVSRVR